MVSCRRTIGVQALDALSLAMIIPKPYYHVAAYPSRGEFDTRKAFCMPIETLHIYLLLGDLCMTS